MQDIVAIIGNESSILPRIGEHDNSPDKLKIYTLGKFVAMKNSQVISEKAKHSSKLWELFKFFLTYRNIAIPIEKIVDSLWPDQEYMDPNAALHTLTHRVRKLFYEEFSAGNEPFNLAVSQGCYKMKLNSNCWVDADDFIDSSRKAAEYIDSDHGVALQHHRQATRLYQGEYLPEYTSKKWLLPSKRYYRHLYLQNLLGKIKIYMDSRQYKAVSSVCEKAFQVEQFMEVEALHLSFIEALYRSGKTREALCHYDYLTSSLYQEFGTKPTPAMRDLYRKIKPDVESTALCLNEILDRFKEQDGNEGALSCDLDTFRFLYNLELRRHERTNKELVLLMFSLNGINTGRENKSTANKVMNLLEELMLQGLRKGDVITPLNESQFLVFLSEGAQVNANNVIRRICDEFNKSCQYKEVKLEITRKNGI